MVSARSEPPHAAGGLLPSPAVSAAGGVRSGATTEYGDPVASPRRSFVMAAVAYVVSRICVIAGAAGVSTARDVTERLLDPSKLPPNSAIGGIFDVLNSWDGRWYYTIVRDWYPSHVQPNVDWNMADARAAFFPLYPFLVRVVDRVLPGGDVGAALTMNMVLGFAAVLVVGMLARRLYDETVAERAMMLMALFPGSYVLSFAYSEATMFLLVGLCLLALLERRWFLAGVAAALVTMARPNGVAICFACAAAAGVAIRDRREWKSLIAPVLSPLGWLAFQIGLGRHASENWVWFRVQREAWGEGLSFGMTAVKGIGSALTHPLSSPGNLITLSTVGTAIIMIYAAWKVRLKWPLSVYSAVIIALMLLPSTVAPRPRFLYTAFPLLIGVAAWWRPRWRDQWTLLMVISGAGLVVLPVLYGGFAAIP